MNCTDFMAKLTDYFDGEIDPDLLLEVKAHLAACHHCEVVVNTCRKTIDVYRDHEVYDFPDELSQRLRAAVKSRCDQVGRKPKFIEDAMQTPQSSDAHKVMQ